MTKRVIDEMTKYKLLVTLARLHKPEKRTLCGQAPLSKTNNGGNKITAGQ
jgi:hypothetical protein